MEMKKLERNLRSLPKYSLNDEQKDRILRTIKKKAKRPKRNVKPFLAFVCVCATAFLLFFISQDGEKQYVEPTNELAGSKAVVFKNADNEVLGVEGKVGILSFNNHFVAKDFRRVSKLMLYFWGDPTKLVGKNYHVEAVNETNEKLVLSVGKLGAPLRHEDAHTLTSFPPFPKEGTWQLSFFVEDTLFEQFQIEVLAPFPETEHYTLNVSPMEMKVGEELELSIESSLGMKEEIDVVVLDRKERIVSEHLFMREGDGSEEATLHFYEGRILLPGHGTWSLLVDGEKTQPFQN